MIIRIYAEGPDGEPEGYTLALARLSHDAASVLLQHLCGSTRVSGTDDMIEAIREADAVIQRNSITEEPEPPFFGPIGEPEPEPEPKRICSACKSRPTASPYHEFCGHCIDKGAPNEK